MKGICVSVGLLVSLGLTLGTLAQEVSPAEVDVTDEVDAASPAGEASPAVSGLNVLRLIRFHGTARGAQGRALAGTVGITFALYREQGGGAPLWLETQNVALDQRGHYTALLGATSNDGLPLEVFSSGEARWLGIQVHGQAEQRVLLVSVPYALKAAEAETLSGRKASDFILSEQLSTRVEEEISTQVDEQGLMTSEAAANLAQVTGSGTVGQIAKFVTSTEVGDSVITEANGRIGIGFGTPVQKLVIGATGGRMLNVSNLANQDLEIRVSTRFAADRHALIAPTTPTNLALGVGGDEKMRITNAGDVGIGTSLPSARLDVAGSANITGSLQVTDTGGSAIIGTTSNAGANASGMRGFATAATGNTIGVWGNVTSQDGVAGLFDVDVATPGLILEGRKGGVTKFTLDGDGNLVASGNLTTNSTSGNLVIAGTGNSSIAGNLSATSFTASTSGTTAVSGTATAGSGQTFGVFGQSDSTGGVGVFGDATTATGNNFGVAGRTASSDGVGISGEATAVSGNTRGVLAQISSSSGIAGFFLAPSDATVIEGRGGGMTVFQVDGAGNTSVGGTLTKNGGAFKIDHPLDPANKYLYHSFVESPDMMNIYNGVVVLDRKGEAVVSLPEWFEALNRDFRYQLTCIGGFAPVYIADEIRDKRFKIAGGKPGLEVSWQVTGIRQDAYARDHRIPVEEAKTVEERGRYLYPEGFGQPLDKSVNWAGKGRQEPNSQRGARAGGGGR